MPLLAFLALVLSAAAVGACRDAIGEHRSPVIPLRGTSLHWPAFAAIALLLLTWTACGGSTTSSPQQNGTPAGTYALAVTATASGVSKTSTLTLKVN